MVWPHDIIKTGNRENTLVDKKMTSTINKVGYIQIYPETQKHTSIFR